MRPYPASLPAATICVRQASLAHRFGGDRGTTNKHAGTMTHKWKNTLAIETRDGEQKRGWGVEGEVVDDVEREGNRVHGAIRAALAREKRGRGRESEKTAGRESKQKGDEACEL